MIKLKSNTAHLKISNVTLILTVIMESLVMPLTGTFNFRIMYYQVVSKEHLRWNCLN